MSNRILFITPGLAKGGAETQMLKIARFLKSRNSEILIISLKEINDFHDILKVEELNVVFLKSNWLLYFIPNLIKLYKIIHKFKPDLVIAFMFIAIVISRLFKLIFPFKLISSIRASRIDRKWALIFKLSSKLDDLVVYNSKTSKTYFENNNFVSNKGIIIGNAISIPKELQNVVNIKFKWISIAHFRIDKDYVTLFKAISLLKSYDFTVDIIGHLYGLKWPSQMVLELGIEDHVNILGFKSNSAEYLIKSDALILSSFSEGMPNAVLEAMAYSKPVIGSEIDSISELLSRSNCGFLFKTGDAKDLSLKMQSLMDMDVKKRLETGNRGREYVESNFDEDLILEHWLMTIKSILKDSTEPVLLNS